MSELIAHSQALEKERRKSGKYKFVDQPYEDPKPIETIDEKAAD